MPDKHGFDTLPRRGVETLRCIWCPAAFPKWTDEARLERHAAKHAEERKAAVEAQRREREIAEAMP